MNSTPERLMKPSEAAEYLGIHVKTLRAWSSAGRIRSKRLGTKSIRFKMSDLQRFVEGRGK